MKIAMLTSDYLPNIGGIASHIHELSKALIANGHEVEVWVWDRKGENPSTKEMGEIPVRIIENEVIPDRFWRSVHLGREIKSFCSDFQPDVVHVHTLDQLMSAIYFVKKKFAVKAVWTNHSSRYLRKSDSLIFKLKMRYYARPFDGLIATCRERLKKSLCLGISEHFCRYIPNGVNPEKFEYIEKSDARASLGISNADFVLLYTGRFAPIKGVFFLVQALQSLSMKIPNILCMMCGNTVGDRESDRIRAFVADNNLERFVRMEGFVQNELLGPYLFACDTLVLPSLMEATSISALEAMSVGRPVVGSRVGGIPELISEGVTGTLAIPGDSADLARAIEKFWKSENRQEMGLNAKKRVNQNFTWERAAERTLRFYSEI